ncbi:glycosyltransferase family 4 protein [Halosimplex marinum]|uniref:glycosyltransferase family 4 protein n=1 Tax=Halosimplex marinum TaxID=3396620 RepID=UPI003F560A1C
MRVLYVTKTSPLADAGGAEKRADEVTGRLADRGHDVTVLSGKTQRDLPKWARDGDRTFRHVRCLPDSLFAFERFAFFASRYLFAVASLPVVCWLLARREFDVVVENMTPYPTLTVLVARALGVPVVAVQHEFYDRECFDTYDPVTASIQLLVQNILRLVTYDAVVVPTDHVRRQLVDYGLDPERLAVVPNGIEAEGYYDPTVERDPTAVVTVGRLSKRKGQSTVIRAFDRVTDEVPEATLHVVGAGPARSALEDLVGARGLADSVTFHGFASEAEKRRLLNAAAVFAFGSHQEGFGLVLLEAMAAGTPVVAVDLPVYDTFFEDGENGHLVARDEAAMADRIESLLADPDRRDAIRDRNLQRAAQFTWAETADGMESVARSVTASGDPAGRS